MIEFKPGDEVMFLRHPTVEDPKVRWVAGMVADVMIEYGQIGVASFRWNGTGIVRQYHIVPRNWVMSAKDKYDPINGVGKGPTVTVDHCVAFTLEEVMALTGLLPPEPDADEPVVKETT